MGANIESTLWEFLKTAQFSLQLDESVLPQNEALLLAYVQFIKGEKLEQELLFAREMIADTKGECVFYTVQGFFQEKGIPLTNIMSVAPDGALSMFFESEDVKLGNNLKKRRGDIAYLSDLYFKFNEMNLQLQGDDLNLIKTKNVISAFVSKLLLFKQNLARGEFYQFPNLCGLKKTDSIPDDDVHVYCDNLNMLHKEMHERYEDILTVTIPPWILDPYSNANEIETFLQEELIELQANEELKPRFKSGYSHFWLQYQIAALYPELWKGVLARKRLGITGLTQARAFGPERSALLKKCQISKGSALLAVTHFIDEKELLRFGGRLDKAQIPLDSRHPIIIPEAERPVPI
ncbi:hypothetical protein M513_12046 [Trichuris suis]|uniref:Uncharacterized protein n=1 Tax=Trichuris suis TaxID=68888 RepID=A0A085LQ12_9BILA|nr:hypothetical protein M513_12046 [Trichuris suis]